MWMFCIAQTHNGQRICIMVWLLICIPGALMSPRCFHSCNIIALDILHPSNYLQHFFNSQKLFWGIMHFKVLYMFNCVFSSYFVWCLCLVFLRYFPKCRTMPSDIVFFQSLVLWNIKHGLFWHTILHSIILTNSLLCNNDVNLWNEYRNLQIGFSRYCQGGGLCCYLKLQCSGM